MIKKKRLFGINIYKEYKANRPQTPQEIIEQIAPVKEFFSLLEIPSFFYIGYESDDILATIAHKLKDKYEQIIFITSDKDFFQLLTCNKYLIYDPMKKKFFNKDNVVEKYGIPTEKFVDYLAIVGDSADNIPGVKGIGPKGAVKLLNEFNNLSEIYHNLEKIEKKSLQEKLKLNKENAFLSLKLATIEKNVSLEIEKINTFKEENFSKIKNLLQEYEINSLLTKISKKYTIKEEKNVKPINNIYIIEKSEELEDLANFFDKKEKSLIFHLENKEKTVLGFCLGDLESVFYLPIKHSKINNLEENLVF